MIYIFRRKTEMKKVLLIGLCSLLFFGIPVFSQKTQKPVLHGRHWIAITGKPLAATAGAKIFEQGGNAIDASCAMLAATCTMWDVLSWGGETQALIYHPVEKKVIGLNALGVAPTGATPQYFLDKGMIVPPAYGPLAAVTPGTPGGLFTMLAEWGTMSLETVLAPAIQLAEGYPIEQQLVETIQRTKKQLKQWPNSARLFFPNDSEGPQTGDIFQQRDLLETLQRFIAVEKSALASGKTRKEAIYAVYDWFYKGEMADEFASAVQAEGGLITKEDLANWKVYIEEPLKTSYKGIDVYKLNTWVQSPAMLQALNMLEQYDLKKLGFNSANYIHLIYQVMSLAFADRDFYYGDPYYPPVEPVNGLMSKKYALDRTQLINWEKNDPDIKPGDPYPYQGDKNPYTEILKNWTTVKKELSPSEVMEHREQFRAGTTTIQAADAEGWVVSVTPSGGWVPAVIAGNTGIGLSQRMQSFVLDPNDNPYNVLEPGKRPRATLTPTIALKDGMPYVSFAVQGGDTQDQNLLQFFLNMVEFGMNVQEACEAPNINSYQMRNSFGNQESEPGKILLHDSTPDWTRITLKKMGYLLEFDSRTSGPINAIYFDPVKGTFQGGSSNYGDDYGIAW
jgi:gamma-glutamyltranspeptidase / glutathione hydrolase